MDGPSHMKSEIKIQALNKEYSVIFNDGFFNDSDKKYFYIVDDYFSEKFIQITEPKIFLSAIEENKNLETTSKIIEFLGAHGCTKAGVLIAVGGGITQDLCTLSASLYMRGIEWVYYPTTLASMIDSCIGGKSSINVGVKKNIIGNFYPPSKIVIDFKYIDSLSPNDISAGLLEGVKITFAKGPEEFRKFIFAYETKNFEEIIEVTLLSKKWFIEVDEYDVAERKLLNFGHTFGHAIEAAGNFSITHGVAVGVGMQFAIDLANRLSPSNQAASRTESLNIYLTSLLKNVPHLAEHLNAIDADQLFDKFESDKKHTDKYFIMILPAKDGFLGKESVNKDALFKSLFKESFKYIQECYEIQ
jgi:3-dehydroquinate synthase